MPSNMEHQTLVYLRMLPVLGFNLYIPLSHNSRYQIEISASLSVLLDSRLFQVFPATNPFDPVAPGLQLTVAQTSLHTRTQILILDKDRIEPRLFPIFLQLLDQALLLSRLR